VPHARRPPFLRRKSLSDDGLRRKNEPGVARDAIDEAAVDMSVRLGELELPNPIVAASGTFGHGNEVARLCDPGELGAITAKSLAPYEWPGSPPPRLHMTAGGMINAVGLQGPGVEYWVAHELAALHAMGGRVIASVWGQTIEEFALATKMLRPAREWLVAIEVNVSCPNLHHHSEMFAHDPGATAAAVDAVVAQDLALPVFAKLSPNVTDIAAIAAAALDAGAIGITAINTVLGLLVDAETRRPILGRGTGGLSGPAVKPIALRAVHELAGSAPAGTPIIGTGGVTTGVDAVEMLLAGATAVGVGTATFHDPRATIRIRDELLAWCAAHGVARVADLTGALQWPDPVS
jgi:dihydroorotate dehydrogenase (NAD+) catalytic subunit